MRSISLDDVLGTWVLDEFNVLDEKDVPILWEGECHGHLVYTEDSFVSACINRVVEGKRRDSLYFAKVEFLDDGYIRHNILESSIVSLIDTTFDRYADFENDRLILRGEGPSGRLKIIWSRVL